jgi:hypothetical protein
LTWADSAELPVCRGLLVFVARVGWTVHFGQMSKLPEVCDIE